MKEFDVCVKEKDCGIKNWLTTTVIRISSEQEIDRNKDKFGICKEYESAKCIQNCKFWIPTSMKWSKECLHWDSKIDNYDRQL